MADFEQFQYLYPFTVRDRRLRYSALSTGLQTVAVEGPAQRWEIDVELEDTVDSGFLQTHQARHGVRTPFLVRMPQLRGVPRFTIDPTPFHSSPRLLPGINPTPPINPDSIQVRAYPNFIDLEWEPPEGFAPGVSNYALNYRPETPTQGSFVNNPDIGEVPSYQVTGLTPGVRYSIRILHWRGTERSTPVNMQITTPMTRNFIKVNFDTTAPTNIIQVQLDSPGSQTLKRGLFIRFAGSTKIHQVISDTTVTQSPSNIFIYPVLGDDIKAGAVVDVDPAMLARWSATTPFEIEFSPISRPTAYWEEAV